MARRRNLALELAKGALAGAAATLVMGQVNRLLYQSGAPGAKRKEARSRGGRTAPGVAAEKIATLFGQHLTTTERQRLGVMVHWGLGIGTTALYAALRHQAERLEWGRGVALGTTFWGLVDEGMSPALGLAPPPGDLPWQAHARTLAGNVTYGLVASSALRLLDRYA